MNMNVNTHTISTPIQTYISTPGCQPFHTQVIDIQRNFGTLHATTYSLLRSMLGGINWGILCRSAERVRARPAQMGDSIFCKK